MSDGTRELREAEAVVAVKRLRVARHAARGRVVKAALNEAAKGEPYGYRLSELLDPPLAPACLLVVARRRGEGTVGVMFSIPEPVSDDDLRTVAQALWADLCD